MIIDRLIHYSIREFLDFNVAILEKQIIQKRNVTLCKNNCSQNILKKCITTRSGVGKIPTVQEKIPKISSIQQESGGNTNEDVKLCNCGDELINN